MSKTDRVKAKLAKNPNPSPQEIKGWAVEIGCSKGLVYKWLNRMPQGLRMAETPAEPVVRIEEEAEEIIEPPAEETAEAEFEVPSEFTEEPAEAVEVEEEEEPAEISLEEEEEEQRILKKISKRAVMRLFNIAIEEGLGLGKDLGLTDQEAEDTEFLIMVMLTKYLMIEVKENMLEVTGALHFGSIGAKLLVAWIKKRRDEGKREEEKPVKTEPPEKPEIVETTEAVEVPMSTAEETKEDAEEIREKQTKTPEKDFVKRVTGGNM